MRNAQVDKRIFKLHADLCKTLANPTRLEILSWLREGERSVSELIALTDVRQATISQHLAVLRQRRVVSTRKEGANIFYKIAHPKIVEACDLIREVMFEQLAEMEKLVKKAVVEIG
ncbi:MAG: ArsR/SmtB family transcription factor [Candidatus Heimdallarchaeota archaeon]